MTLLFDYMRGTRLLKNGENTMKMVTPLKKKFFNRDIRIGFYHNPDTGGLKGKYADASPLREIFGVHHIKAHVFDNNVLITGANLSEDYFTDRQDRCMVIQDCEPLADYFDDLIHIITDCSYNLNDSGFLQMLDNYPSPDKATKKFKQQLSHHIRFFRYNHKTNFEVQSDSEPQTTMEEFFSDHQETEEHHFLAR